MVEAAGIEPASESTTLRLLHVYSVFSISDHEAPTGRLFIIPSSLRLISGREELSETSLHSDAFSRTQAIPEERAAFS